MNAKINFRKYSQSLWIYRGLELSYNWSLNKQGKKPWNLTNTYKGKPKLLKDGKGNFEAHSLWEINEYIKNLYKKEINIDEIKLEGFPK